MIILAIETSCDETAISVLKANGSIKHPKFEILSNIVASQIKIHAHWGGVVPNLAKREHLKNLPVVLKKALSQSKLKNPEKKINAIAVTIGPGLEPALWTGINFAVELAEKWKKQIIPINHMEGHIFASLLNSKNKIEFPALALLVSGGHTELVLMSAQSKPASGWNYKIIGQTRDDAAGEAFDKVAKMLNLAYPGGPKISKLAEKINSSEINLPRPMINSKNYDFSFSGLKTAVLYLIQDLKNKKINIKKITPQICHEFQQAVIDVLISKTIRAAKEYKIKTVILGGGVAANKELRKQLKNSIKNNLTKTNLIIPNLKFTTDNAVMIAAVAYFHTDKKSFGKIKINPSQLKANGNLTLK